MLDWNFLRFYVNINPYFYIQFLIGWRPNEFFWNQKGRVEKALKVTWWAEKLEKMLENVQLVSRLETERHVNTTVNIHSLILYVFFFSTKF